MRGLITAVVATSLFCAGELHAHNVIYTSLAGTFTQKQEAMNLPVYPMTLTFGSLGDITVQPSTGEHCIVVATLTASSSLVTINPANATARQVFFQVSVAQPVMTLVTVSLSGTWRANGHQDNGLPDDPQGCGGKGTISATLSILPPFITPYGNTPFGGSTDEPISTSTGELFGHDTAPDLSLSGPLPLTFQRYYGSFLGPTVPSGLGTNWMHNFDLRVTQIGSTAIVTMFRGKTVTFTQNNAAWQLSSNELRPYQLTQTAAGYQFLNPVSNLIYGFDGNGVLTQIADRNGNTLTVTEDASGMGPSLVSDGLGRTLTFTYSGTNLASVKDQSGRSVSFEYANGTLSALTDANGKRSTFTYTTAGNLTGLLTAETRPAGNQPFTQKFDSLGRVSSQADSFSNSMTLAYSANGATVTHPLGSSFTDVHDAQNSLTGLSDPGGGSSQYTYDSQGHPITVTDRLGAKTSAAWDPSSGLPASYTDELGNTTSFKYASSTQSGFTFSDLSVVRFADGTSLSFSRDSQGNVTSYTDAAGQIWKATRNTRGQVATLTNPSGGVTTYSYGQDGALTAVQLNSGDAAKIAYDAISRPTQVTWPDHAVRAFQYDPLDSLTRITDELGRVTAASFDNNENLHSVTDALNAAASFNYDGDDRLASATDPAGSTTHRTYDALSRLMSVTNAAGNSVSYAYDSLNRPISATDAAGKAATFGWDQEARLTSISDPLGRKTTFTRDARGLITAIASPNGEKVGAAYDTLGLLTSLTDPLGQSGQLSYDARGQLIGVAMPAGIAASFKRNELGLITALTDPNGNVWRQNFDKMGRLISSSDPLGHSATLQYDSRQRLSQAAFAQGNVQLSYDAAGNLTTQSYSDGTSFNFTYDAARRVTSAAGVTLAYDANGRIISSNGLAITPDAVGRVASITYGPGKVVSYKYDNRGLLSSVTDWVGGSTAFTYDDAGELTGVVFPNGVHETATYDKNGRAATINVTSGSTAISSITFHRDAAGEVISADRSTANVPAPPSGTLTLAYDAAGQSSSSSYDAAGRLVSDALRTYKWDLASRLGSYTGADGSASFTYDAFGQRSGRSSGNATQSFVLNYALGLPAVSVVRSASADQRYYVWLPSGVLLYSIEANGNARHFYHFDETGSTNFLTDDAGKITDSYAITPYGESVAQTGSTDNPFTFQGAYGVMQEGATGLFYMRARYYDSAGARFLSRDPLGALDPRALNPYQYAAGNPLRFNDPTGLEPGLQGQPFTVVANAGTPVIVRVEGITELVGDLLLHPASPQLLQPGQIPEPTFNLALPANLAFQSYINLAPNLSAQHNSEALLLIDEPGSGLLGYRGFIPPVPAPPSAPTGQNAPQTASPGCASVRLRGRVTITRPNLCELRLPSTETPLVQLIGGGRTQNVTSPFQRDSRKVLNTTPITAFIGQSLSAASSNSPIPRFVDNGCSKSPFAVSVCRTALLFPFVTNTAGFDTGLAISNTTTDPFGTGPATLYVPAIVH